MALFEGGAALPVTSGGTGQTEARAAVPVYVVSGGPVIGQRARRVVVVTTGPVEGGAAKPVYDAGAGALYSNEAALPVFIVPGGGSLSGGAAPITYLFRDLFTTPDAAPVASPRTNEPGPGTTTITDTLNTLDISGGEMVPNAKTTGLRDPWERDAAGYARTIGRAFIVQIKRVVPSLAVDANEPLIGWVTTLTTPTENQSYGVIFSITLGNGFLPVTLGSFGGSVDPTANNTYYTICVMLRNPGYMVFIDSKLAYVGNTGAEATLYPSIMARAAGKSPGQYGNWRGVDLPAPFDTQYGLASDRKASAIVGDTITPASADANIEGAWTAVTGQAWNLYVRRTNDSNAYVVRCDQTGSTIKWIEINAGVETEKSSVAQTFTNGTIYRLFVSLQGSLVVTTINNVVKNVRSDATFNQTVIGAKTDRALTDFIAWPRSVPQLSSF